MYRKLLIAVALVAIALPVAVTAQEAEDGPTAVDAPELDTFRGTIVCRRCDLRQTDSCDKALRLLDGRIVRLLPSATKADLEAFIADSTGCAEGGCGHRGATEDASSDEASPEGAGARAGGCCADRGATGETADGASCPMQRGTSDEAEGASCPMEGEADGSACPAGGEDTGDDGSCPMDGEAAAGCPMQADREASDGEGCPMQGEADGDGCPMQARGDDAEGETTGGSCSNLGSCQRVREGLHLAIQGYETTYRDERYIFAVSFDEL